MKVSKYYGTNTFLYGDMNEKIVALGYKGCHNQFRIVCKSKSRAEANRMAESFGLSKNTFEANNTSETGNKLEIEEADKHIFIIALDGMVGHKYIGIRELIK